jgi:hypothetical protein
VAAGPSSTGIRMPIKATSGRCRRAASSAWRPSSASPTTSMSGSWSSVLDSPGGATMIAVDLFVLRQPLMASAISV